MRQVVLPEVGTFKAWRDAARGLLGADVPPEEVLWQRGSAGADLFAQEAAPVTTGAATVPRGFVQLAKLVVWHRDPERFARLYALLWALRTDRRLIEDRGDPRIARLNRMAKEVGRDRHKMHAFVRFREIGEDVPRRRFAAWFEPTHYILEPSAPFFEARFADMDWSIFTPDLSAHYEDGTLRFDAGADKPALPPDATEDLWRTYFRNIFNPARVKVAAMTSEMPRKYWRNMPETAEIPALLATAQARAVAMAEAAPTLPPKRAGAILARRDTQTPPQSFETALSACRRCPLWENATQAVPGEGPDDAPLMIVGEQPGDMEDLAGRPFVGPAGQLFDKVAARAGLARERAYITNAVKHFKFTPRGKRRLHQAPSAGEIAHCRWWLDLERERVRPRLILAMGATALDSLTGDRRGLLKRRGGIEETADGTPVLITLHPSYLLRLPSETRPQAEALIEADLRRAAELTA
ncbi:UdgX family uracil-DNA binding protein [Rhodalgimonas zhirmunskyi]|uniref:Type-4 uracil-DNA glycosylase n=1 Tax=Rhodalgimonas zhirmunskyi TaxID=2964767 RepID=A0AAJ1U7I2_9RHOB|nr:UdgX family uracil-DNA binding protein [Rhodoalgimonas zhirmunskyi]MDQ2092733.1 UdgX family uracil-DNA binding protein [Rhodoalgimonas zhirmunskyi]